MKFDLWNIIVIAAVLGFIFADDDTEKIKEVVSAGIDKVHNELVVNTNNVHDAEIEVVMIIDAPVTVEPIKEPKLTFIHEQLPLSFEEQIFQARMNGVLPSYCEKFGKYLECEQIIDGERVRMECEENNRELTCEIIK